MSTDLLSMHLASATEGLLGGNTDKKKSKKVVKSHIEKAKSKLEEKTKKLQSAVERLGKEQNSKHSRGDMLKVIRANKSSGKLKKPRFLKPEK